MAASAASGGSYFQRLWNHPAGPRTIHFWAPAAKWALVIAGIGDLKRPAEKLSPTQSGALAATGLIWSRYSTQIIPVNYNLLSVNLFVGMTGFYQLWRIYEYRKSLPPGYVPPEPTKKKKKKAKVAADETTETAK